MRVRALLTRLGRAIVGAVLLVPPDYGANRDEEEPERARR